MLRRIPHIESERLELRRLSENDAADLNRLVGCEAVYRYLPTFLFERKYGDAHRVIDRLYTECLQESIILGVFLKEGGAFAGLAEFYGFREPIHKVSIGYRFLPEFWGRGIATEAVRLMTDYLLTKTSIDIITASTMVENKASARVLMKNGFSLVAAGADEDWGFGGPTPTDKWLL